METKKKTVKKKSKSHLQAQSTKRKTEKLQSIAKVGKTAPSIILPDQNGVVHTLKEHNGNWLLIYFYPKDDTQGCTKEACGIRDSFPQFKKLGISVFGISADSVSRHKKFEEKYLEYHMPLWCIPGCHLLDKNKSVASSHYVP
jgi:peroxiredoxin